MKENNMPTLPSTDIDQALEYFDRTKKRIFEVTTGLTDTQWHFKPAADRWSIAENLEHMVTVEERILGPIRELLAQAPPPPAAFDSALVDQIIFEKIPDRSNKVAAPEFINPSGQLSPADALERLSRNYQRLSEYVASTPGLREHILDSPPLKHVTNGAHTCMDGFQWTLALAAHDRRHIGQIVDLQADANYPQRS
jgi:hypothetical protein